MKTWQKMALIILAVVLIAGVRLYFVFKARQDPGVVATKNAAPTLSKDDLAVVKVLDLASLDDAKQLEGKPVWVKAGYSLPYYPYVDGKIVFAKKVGVLPAAQKLEIAKLDKAAAPAKEDDRVPHGTRQYFAVFALGNTPGTAGADGKGTLYAAPIGYIDGKDEKFFTDQLFFYDDPKTIYDNWPASVWDQVAAHEPKVGMTENQTRMALGIIQTSDSQHLGDRTVTYDLGNGKTWTVTFVNGAATAVKAGTSAG